MTEGGFEGEFRLTVDRVEGDLIVLLDAGRKVVELPGWALPPAVRSGDVVAVTTTFHDDIRTVRAHIDRVATAAARAEALARLARLRIADDGGDVAL